MCISEREKLIYDYFSAWIIANKNEWLDIYNAIDCGNFVFDTVVDGANIKDQFVYFLRWLLESENLKETTCGKKIRYSGG